MKQDYQLDALGLSLEEIDRAIPLYFEDPSGKRAKVKVLELLRGHLAETEAQLSCPASPTPSIGSGTLSSVGGEHGKADPILQTLLQLTRSPIE